MSTNRKDEIEKLLTAQLMKYLKVYGFVSFEDDTSGIRWCNLMGTKIMMERYPTLVKLMVELWMEKGINTMNDFKTKEGKKTWEILIMVKEHAEKSLIASEGIRELGGAIVEEWMENGITTMSEFVTLKGMNLDEVVAMVKELVTAYLAEMGV
ncbi:hypothetical protein BGX38DRAFT_1276803 [Terfezia claveryi]|nr:hypothetical protein BGX38DRAFT_1276803 [Terfezia claveryi]